MVKLLLAATLACAVYAADPFAWTQSGKPVAYDELLEGKHPVLRYNYATLLPKGVAEDRARCCYLYPLWTPGGVSILDDFPADHPHHRGIFWAWPYVGIGSETYDIWDLRGIKTENAGHHAGLNAKEQLAVLDVDNVWVANGKRVAKMHENYTVHAARDNSRLVECILTLTALDAPVTLKGSHEAGKSYGGFGVRFAPREQTVIRTEAGVSEQDQDLNPHQWAELEAVYKGHKAALRIDNFAQNPGGTPQMTLRHYGYLGVSYPGKTPLCDAATLDPGKPLTLVYIVRVSDR